MAHGIPSSVQPPLRGVIPCVPASRVGLDLPSSFSASVRCGEVYRTNQRARDIRLPSPCSAPACEAADWNPERIDVVLAHEFVHIQRRDWLTQLLAQFSACVYWFHPFAWIALKQMRKERELACDDGVLRLGLQELRLAQHLVDVARCVRNGVEALSPSVAMACRAQLESRIRAILNPAINRGNVTTMMKLSATACTVLAFFCSLRLTAPLQARTLRAQSPIRPARMPEALLMLTP